MIRDGSGGNWGDRTREAPSPSGKRPTESSLDRRTVLTLTGVGASSLLAGCLTEAERLLPGGDEEGNDGAAGRDEGGDESADVDSGNDEGEADDDEGEPVEHSLPFEEDFDDLEAIHQRSDGDSLGLDTSSRSRYARPASAAEATDDARLNRLDDADATVVFQFAEAIGRIRLEAHVHPDEDGDVTIATSTDGDTWTDVDADRTQYSEAHNDETEPGHWWESYEYVATAAADETFLQLTISGSVNWTPQLGHLEVTPPGADESPRAGHALPFEDEFDDLTALHESSTRDNLGRDTTNVDQFARPSDADDETDPSRVNRLTENDARIVYRFADPLSGVSAQTHVHPDGQGELTVAVSADGETWANVEVDQTLYSEAHNDEAEPGHWWGSYEYAADDLEEDLYYLRFTLAGDTNWSPQLGRIDVW